MTKCKQWEQFRGARPNKNKTAVKNRDDRILEEWRGRRRGLPGSIAVHIANLGLSCSRIDVLNCLYRHGLIESDAYGRNAG